MNEKPRVNVMLALELLADRAYRDEDAMRFAIVDEAAFLEGFAPAVILDVLSHPRDEMLRFREAARKGRHAAPLRAKATGLLLALNELAESGLLDGHQCSEERRLLWLADQPVPPPQTKTNGGTDE